MVSDWLKRQKKATRTKQIRAVLITKFNTEKIFQKREQSKKYVFLAKSIKNVVLRENYPQQNRGK